MKSKKSLKTLIIGLDGATFDLILPFIEKGELPCFTYLLKNGAWGELASTLPPVTATAWPSFMTGENPGKHGILKFIQIDSGPEIHDAHQQAITSKSFAGRTFFDVMKMNGNRVGAVTIPVTYPPWDINGIMISGYPSPDNNKIYSVSPHISLNFDKALNFDASYYQTASEEQILEDCLQSDRLRSDLTFDLLQSYEFESFTVVFGGIDRACHDYWKYHDSEFPEISAVQREKFKDAILRNYKLADEEISRYLNHFGDEANLFIISDHGSGRSPTLAFNANVWLKKNNLLKLRGSRTLVRQILRKVYKGAQFLMTPRNRKSSVVMEKMRQRASTSKVFGGHLNTMINWEKTEAFYYPLLYPVDGIMVNLKGRQACGIVDSGSEKEELVRDIIQSLLEYRDEETGDKVIEKAFRREEIYSGPFTDQFPDIVYFLNRKYMGGRELGGSVTMSIPRFRLLKRSGMHLLNGVFIAHGPKIKPQRIYGARIIDIAPTLLYCSELPVPNSMDGRVLSGIFPKEILNTRPIEYFNFESKKMGNNDLIDEKENEQMKEKLRSLGYID
jgi:predicted AlkP superfamily phosphohydrolase/phosphomutase